MAKPAKKGNPVVLVVDDDASLLRAIARLIRTAGFEVRAFERPDLLLSSDLPKTDACLVIDVYLPEMNGVELFDALKRSGCSLPVMMITGQNDSKTKQLLNRIDPAKILLKPFDGNLLLKAIQDALSPPGAKAT